MSEIQSEGYNRTHGYHESTLKSHKVRTAAVCAAYLIPSILPNMRILDVGCGPATITVGLAELVPEGHVVGLDLSDDVLTHARALAQERQLENIEFQIGSVLELPFPDATFDVVHSHQVLQHLQDPVKALREMRRVTKPGGIVAARASDFSTVCWYPDSKGIEHWKDLWIRVAHAIGHEPDAGRRLLAWALEVGFPRANISASSNVMAFTTPEQVARWGEMWEKRVLSSPFVDTAIDGGYATRGELESISRDWHEWAQSESGWMSNVQGEILCRV